MEVALSFKLKLKSIPVVMDDGNGNKLEYTLRELGGLDRDTFLTEMRNRTDYSDPKNPVISDIMGMQASLLSSSLYDEREVKVSADKLETYPSIALTALFEASQELSRLTDTKSVQAEEDVIRAAKAYGNVTDASEVAEAKQNLLDAASALVLVENDPKND